MIDGLRDAPDEDRIRQRPSKGMELSVIVFYDHDAVHGANLLNLRQSARD